MSPVPRPWRATGNGLRLAVRLTPKASRDEIGAVMQAAGEAVLIVRVRAVPSEGAANAALLALIAKWLGVPKSCVSLASGGKSRAKTVAIAGEPGALAARIAKLLDDA